MSQFSVYNRAENETPYFSYVPSNTAPPPRLSVRRLFVDNRNRHIGSSKSEFDFQIFMGNDERSVGIGGYENVVSVELKAISFPKVVNERYVIMRIDELKDSQLDSTCQAALGAFAIVYFDSDTLATGLVKPLKGVDFYQKQILFKPALDKLFRLSVRFMTSDGQVVTPSMTNNEKHISFMLEITTRPPRV